MRQDASTGEIKDDGSSPEQESTTVDGKPTMHIKVYSPFKVYFDNQAYSISGVNATGPFDVLPRHYPFISLLDPCELVIDAVEGDKSRIRVAGGIMHVKADKVLVFLQV
jgi:F0F1-type ATP synthase epsilon subunit